MSNWQVTIEIAGETVLTLADDHISGAELTPEVEAGVRQIAEAILLLLDSGKRDATPAEILYYRQADV